MKASAKWLIALSPLLLAAAPAVSPLFSVSIPAGYRDWQLVGIAHEADPLNELRAVLGNAAAIAGYRQESLPFADGTTLVKLAWEHVQSEDIFLLAFRARVGDDGAGHGQGLETLCRHRWMGLSASS